MITMAGVPPEVPGGESLQHVYELRQPEVGQGLAGFGRTGLRSISIRRFWLSEDLVQSESES